MRRLLLTRGSFTAALRTAVKAPVTVQVLGEGRLVAGSLNQSRPGRSKRPAQVREVLLRTSTDALIYALTVLPVLQRQGPLRELSSLATRPLGELLFNGEVARSGRATRLSLRFARMTPGHWLRRKALAHGLNVPIGSPARCSCFLYKGQRLWVHELALATLTQTLHAPLPAGHR